MTVLAVRDLHKSFGGVRAVDGVSFEIGRGEFLAMIGPNGAGKSTCFNMINGQLRPDAGDIVFEGRCIADLRPRQISRLGIGRTFQLAATFGSMTVIENVQMALASHHGELYRFVSPLAARRRRQAHEVLTQVGMADAADRACRELAYGDIKRVELAIALATEPRLLLMDEPTAGMAPRERLDIIALVKRLVTERGISVLFTEHSMDVVFAYADRIIVLARGELIADGSVAAIRGNAQVRQVYLGTGKPPPYPAPLAGEGRVGARCCPCADAAMTASDTILEVENLSAWYVAARVLFDLTLRVGRGEVVALMGRNGAGKSTTIKAVMGLMPRRSGMVRFCGQDISALRPYEIARLGVGFAPEDRRVFSGLTVAENLDVGRQAPRRFADGRPVPHWTAARLYELFPNLAEMANRRGAAMSGGEQQMLTVARTLMGNPLLVLLDEPSEGVAPVIVEQMANTIMELKQEGLSVLLSEQNIHFAALVSDRAYILEKGQVQWQGPMAELMRDTSAQRALLSM
jgi:branched-chain amino acid transport system ATP-binding protein